MNGYDAYKRNSSSVEHTMHITDNVVLDSAIHIHPPTRRLYTKRKKNETKQKKNKNRKKTTKQKVNKKKLHDFAQEKLMEFGSDALLLFMCCICVYFVCSRGVAWSGWCIRFTKQYTQNIIRIFNEYIFFHHLLNVLNNKFRLHEFFSRSKHRRSICRVLRTYISMLTAVTSNPRPHSWFCIRWCIQFYRFQFAFVSAHFWCRRANPSNP